MRRMTESRKSGASRAACLTVGRELGVRAADASGTVRAPEDGRAGGWLESGARRGRGCSRQMKRGAGLRESESGRALESGARRSRGCQMRRETGSRGWWKLCVFMVKERGK
jgi:hypothetical protein